MGLDAITDEFLYLRSERISWDAVQGFLMASL